MFSLSSLGIYTLIAGFIASLLMGGLKKASDAIDAMSPVVKQLVVLFISTIINIVSKLTGVGLPDDIHNWSIGIVTTLVTALIAMGLHSVKKGATNDVTPTS